MSFFCNPDEVHTKFFSQPELLITKNGLLYHYQEKVRVKSDWNNNLTAYDFNLGHF